MSLQDYPHLPNNVLYCVLGVLGYNQPQGGCGQVLFWRQPQEDHYYG